MPVGECDFKLVDVGNNLIDQAERDTIQPVDIFLAEAGTGVVVGDLRGVLGTVPDPGACQGCGVNMNSGGRAYASQTTI